MDSIIPLGTGAGCATVTNNTTSNLIKLKDGNYIVIDCGTGIYTEAIRAAQDPSKIIALYVTHLHIDHVGDIIGFADSYCVSPQFKIYGPKGIKEIVSVFEKYNQCGCPYRKNIIELEAQSQQLHTLPNGIGVFTFKIPHGVPCYGYLFEDTNGIRVCCLGDTSGIDLSHFGKIHVLVHEATCGNMIFSYSNHSTAKMAAKCADGVKADHLLLTHFSSRITNKKDTLSICEHAQKCTKAKVWTLFYKEPFSISKYYNV
ncbi:Zinc phosphodiesterase [Entamoeba marina]